MSCMPYTAAAVVSGNARMAIFAVARASFMADSSGSMPKRLRSPQLPSHTMRSSYNHRIASTVNPGCQEKCR